MRAPLDMSAIRGASMLVGTSELLADAHDDSFLSTISL
jgi:hypothetical protein